MALAGKIGFACIIRKEKVMQPQTINMKPQAAANQLLKKRLSVRLRLLRSHSSTIEKSTTGTELCHRKLNASLLQ